MLTTPFRHQYRQLCEANTFEQAIGQLAENGIDVEIFG